MFDLQVALTNRPADVDKVMECYNRYMECVVEKAPTYKQFMQNMELKMRDPEFLDETDILLRADAPQFHPEQAFEMVKSTFIDRMSGRRD